jgi:hypothetical protein
MVIPKSGIFSAALRNSNKGSNLSPKSNWLFILFTNFSANISASTIFSCLSNYISCIVSITAP